MVVLLVVVVVVVLEVVVVMVLEVVVVMVLEVVVVMVLEVVVVMVLEVVVVMVLEVVVVMVLEVVVLVVVVIVLEVNRPWDSSKQFTLHPLADLFIPTPFRLLWEAFSHTALTARRLFVQISISVYSQVLIYTVE